MKKQIKKIFSSLGFEIKRTQNNVDNSYVGKMDVLLEDLKKRGLLCKTILDVGANKTAWSKMAKQVFPTSNFCLIEPQVEMQGYLEKFCEEYKGSVYFLAGAGRESGQLNFTVWDDLEGSSFLPKQASDEMGRQRQRVVEIIAIDDLIKSSKLAIPEIIKLDIQGFELEALKGASITFGVTEVYILEVSFFKFGDLDAMPLFADVVNFMLERNYVVYDFPGFSRRPIDGALGQCDICFVKQNGMFRSTNLWE